MPKYKKNKFEKLSVYDWSHTSPLIFERTQHYFGSLNNSVEEIVDLYVTHRTRVCIVDDLKRNLDTIANTTHALFSNQDFLRYLLVINTLEV